MASSLLARTSSPRSLFAVAALALAACASEGPGGVTEAAPPSEHTATVAEAITQTTVLARSQEWVDAKLLYCQSPNHKSDAIDPACPAICNRTDNPQWDPYRSDCSGFVSWAWGLPAPGRTTGMFAPFDNAVSHSIAATDLAPGDAVNNSTHMMLFKAWVTPGKEAIFQEEPGCSANINYAHEFKSSVTVSGNSIHVSYDGETFTAIRFDSIQTKVIEYAAQYVSQSWPLASAAPIDLVVGETKKGTIAFKNVGAATWKSGVVRFAPIPRDKPSEVHASTWLSPTRVSGPSVDVKPGETGHFEWDLEGVKAGDFKPFFGLVAEGITWFADDGGPSDNVIQVNVHVAPAPSGAGGSGQAGSPGKAGAPAAGGASAGVGGAKSAMGTGGAGGAKMGAAGASSKGGATSSAGGAGGTSAAGSAAAGSGTGGGSVGSSGSDAAGGSSGVAGGAPLVQDTPASGATGGCSTDSRGASSPFAAALAMVGLLVARKRRR